MGIPTKIIKEITNIYSDYLLPGFNNSFRIFTFPSSLKQENISPVFKKGYKNVKGSRRLLTYKPNMSNIFEPFIFEQTSSFMEPFFAKQCGFRKGF